MIEAARTITEAERRKKRKALEFHPLYRQVKKVLTARIADGVWQPGAMLPSEIEISADLGVSYGTVRKALDEMSAENLVVRRQGRGTFVALHDEARILFQFFKLSPDSGERSYPDSRVLSVRVTACDEEAARRLALRRNASVVVIERVRTIADRPCVFERITLPRAMFPRIEKRRLPNNLYELYRSSYGVTIARATERLKAVAAESSTAKQLGLVAGAPLLSIDRVAFGIDGRPAEWRLSLCDTTAIHYLSDLR
jgi:GntR family transcriptional regulator